MRSLQVTQKLQSYQPGTTWHACREGLPCGHDLSAFGNRSIWNDMNPCESRFLDVEKGLRIVLLKASTGAWQTPGSMLYQQKYRRPFSQALITALYVIRFRSSSLQCNSQKRPKAWLQITDCRVCVICCRFKAVRTGQFLTASIKYHCDCYQ